MKPIAHIHTDFKTKFGIPRQAGVVPDTVGEIVFLPAFRNPDALRGLDGFSHLWLLWEFSEAKREGFTPTVRPPRLGGNIRMGVFATRSPFRPNPIGLSSVKLERIDLEDPRGPVIYVRGADLLDGTPIYDIKPYLAYTDSHPDATDGFAGPVRDTRLEVIFPEELRSRLPEEKRGVAVALLSEDPRPHYQSDDTRIYGMPFAGFDIRFTVKGDTLTVIDIQPL